MPSRRCGSYFKSPNKIRATPRAFTRTLKFGKNLDNAGNHSQIQHLLSFLLQSRIVNLILFIFSKSLEE